MDKKVMGSEIRRKIFQWKSLSISTTGLPTTDIPGIAHVEPRYIQRVLRDRKLFGFYLHFTKALFIGEG